MLQGLHRGLQGSDGGLGDDLVPGNDSMVRPRRRRHWSDGPQASRRLWNAMRSQRLAVRSLGSNSKFIQREDCADAIPIRFTFANCGIAEFCGHFCDPGRPISPRQLPLVAEPV